MRQEFAIKVDNLTKIFKLPHEQYSTAKQHFVNLLRPGGFEKFKALDSVSFDVKKGEFFGIIGSNGSGKSTLLKILAKIYEPTNGKVEINGSLSPFIELGVGFNPELTARDNIFLNAAILGLSRKETEEKFNEIIDFAELREFVDQKLKNFSSGMQVRLAFSIAVQAHSEILLVDEVLAVGDAAFQQKCLEVFRKLKKEGKTIVFVSHALGIIEEFCDRCILVRRGRIQYEGKPNEVVLEYMRLTAEEERKNLEKEVSNSKVKNVMARIVDVECFDQNGEEKLIFNTGEDLVIQVKIEKTDSNKPLNFGVAVFRDDGTYCFGINTIIDRIDTSNINKKFRLKLNNIKLLAGSYYLVTAIFGKDDHEVIDFRERSAIFKVVGKSNSEGIIYMDHAWDMNQ